MKLRDIFKRTEDQPITPEQKMTEQPKKSAGPEEVAKHLESLAREKEVEVLAQCEAKAEEFRADHQSDLDRWKFECRRYGDFLSLFVRRAVDASRTSEFFSASINLSIVTRMEMGLGHKPDWMGSIRYAYDLKKISEDAPNGWIHPGRLTMPPDGYEFQIHPAWPWRQSREIITPVEEGMRYLGCNYGTDYNIKLITPNCPRPAEDDRITFYGPGQILHTPAGLGQAAYDAILEQCAEWDRFARGSRI